MKVGTVLGLVACGVLIVAIVTALVIVQSRNSGRADDPKADAEFSHHVEAWQRHEASLTPTPAPIKPEKVADVVEIGDSWSAGFGAKIPTTGNWIARAAAHLGWNVTKFAMGGAGYLHTGQYAKWSGNYRYELKMAASRAPHASAVNLVIIEGGINDTDWRLKPELLTRAFGATIQEAHRLFPHAEVIALGPMAPTKAYELAVSQVNDTLAAAANAAHVPYIDAYRLGWFSAQKRSGLVNLKIVHPVDAGYELIANQFASYVRKAGLK